MPEFKKNADGSFLLDSEGEYVINEKDSSDGLFKIRCYKPRIEGLFARIERWTEKCNRHNQMAYHQPEIMLLLYLGGLTIRESTTPNDNIKFMNGYLNLCLMTKEIARNTFIKRKTINWI